MADFQTSTHRSKWIFSPQKLIDKHTAANKRARQTLDTCGATLMEVDVDGSLTYPQPHPNANDNGQHLFSILFFIFLNYFVHMNCVYVR